MSTLISEHRPILGVTAPNLSGMLRNDEKKLTKSNETDSFDSSPLPFKTERNSSFLHFSARIMGSENDRTVKREKGDSYRPLEET